MNNLKPYIKIAGTSFLLVAFIVLVLTFVPAYLNDHKTYTININSIGEADFEMWILLPVSFFVGLMAWFIILQEGAKELKGEKHEKPKTT